MKDVDREILAAVFQSRLELCKMAVDEVADAAEAEFHSARKWIKSSSTKSGSFLWFCEEFDLDPGAVRRTLKEQRG